MAQAEDNHEGALPQADWAVAGGLYVGGGGLGGGVGGLTSGYPGGALLLERRLSDQLWLLGELSGGYGVSGAASASSELRDQQHEGFDIRAALGVRWVVTPDEPFRFSLYGVGVAGGGAAYAGGQDADDITVLYTSLNRDFGARAGLTLEYAVSEQMSLGLSSDVVRAGWGQSVWRQRHGRQVVSEYAEESWYAGLSLRPMAQLRMFF